PRFSSSLRMLKVSVGWVTNRAVAAALIVPASATARNWLSSLSMLHSLRIEKIYIGKAISYFSFGRDYAKLAASRTRTGRETAMDAGPAADAAAVSNSGNSGRSGAGRRLPDAGFHRPSASSIQVIALPQMCV